MAFGQTVVENFGIGHVADRYPRSTKGSLAAGIVASAAVTGAIVVEAISRSNPAEFVEAGIAGTGIISGYKILQAVRERLEARDPMRFSTFYQQHEGFNQEVYERYMAGDSDGASDILQDLNALHREHPSHTQRAWDITLQNVMNKRSARGELTG